MVSVYSLHKEDIKTIILKLKDNGVLRTDIDNPDNILVYRNSGSVQRKGWYSEPYAKIVDELHNNKDSLKSLLYEIEKIGYNITKKNNELVFTERR